MKYQLWLCWRTRHNGFLEVKELGTIYESLEEVKLNQEKLKELGMWTVVVLVE